MKFGFRIKRRADSLLNDNNRLLWIDYLRVTSLFAVLMLHLSAKYLTMSGIGTTQWYICLFYDSLCRFAVPVFLMISGCIFLHYKANVKNGIIYRKYLARIIVVFLLWSLLFALIDGEHMSFRIFAEGHYHLWYLRVIAVLYLLLPLTRKVYSHKTITAGVLAVTFIVAFVLPIGDQYKLLRIITGYLFYFLMGAFLRDKYTNFNTHRIAFMLFIFGALGVFFFSAVSSTQCEALIEKYMSYFCIFVFMESIGVFLLFLGETRMEKQKSRIISNMAVCGMGIYLTHPILVDLIPYNGLISCIFLPLTVLIILCLTWLATFLIQKIPMLGRYII